MKRSQNNSFDYEDEDTKFLDFFKASSNDISVRKSASKFKFGDKHLRRRATIMALQQIRAQPARELDPADEERRYFEERELVKKLDNFDGKVPHALNLFTQNLHIKLKSAMGSKNRLPIAQLLQRQDDKPRADFSQ